MAVANCRLRFDEVENFAKRGVENFAKRGLVRGDDFSLSTWQKINTQNS
jgi:hypothetical protein